MQSTNRIGCFNSKENHMGSSMKSNTHEFLDISHETKKKITYKVVSTATTWAVA